MLEMTGRAPPANLTQRLRDYLVRKDGGIYSSMEELEGKKYFISPVVPFAAVAVPAVRNKQSSSSNGN